jgi:hypothetical protein
MQTYHIEMVVSKDGILTIEGLPLHQPYFNFHEGGQTRMEWTIERLKEMESKEVKSKNEK